MLAILFRPFAFIAQKDFYIIWLFMFFDSEDLIDIIPETRCAHLSPFFFVVVVKYYICRYI
jgi:hypothetical protein